MEGVCAGIYITEVSSVAQQSLLFGHPEQQRLARLADKVPMRAKKVDAHIKIKWASKTGLQKAHKTRRRTELQRLFEAPKKKVGRQQESKDSQEEGKMSRRHQCEAVALAVYSMARHMCSASGLSGGSVEGLLLTAFDLWEMDMKDLPSQEFTAYASEPLTKEPAVKVFGSNQPAAPKASSVCCN